MRWFPAALAAAGCVALGVWASRRLEKREQALRDWESALMRMEGAVLRGGESLPGILREGGTPLLEEAARRIETSPAPSPREWAKQLPWDELFTPAELDVLKDCLAGLFAPTAEAQLRSIAHAREQWALFRRLGREAMEKNARLYLSLGWLAGAAVFILIC